MAGADLDRILDRTLGKPKVTMEIQTKTERKPTEILEDLAQMIEKDPGVLEALWPKILPILRSTPSFRERLRPVLEQHQPDLLKALPIINTTATERPSDKPSAERRAE